MNIVKKDEKGLLKIVLISLFIVVIVMWSVEFGFKYFLWASLIDVISEIKEKK